MKEYCIGFDIGGTKCAVSLGEIENGEIRILKREETPTQYGGAETLAVLAPFVKAWTAEKQVERAGVSCGSPLDSKTGVIICPPNLAEGWYGFDIVAYIRKEFGLVARLQNDANACAVAEWKFGAGQGSNNMVFLTFGTGLGAGLILDGKLYSGTNDNAGETGHIRLAKSGPVGYGKVGSFEGFCSGGGITRLAQEMASRCKEMPKCIVDMGGMYAITTKKLAQAAFAGDKFAKRVFAKSGEMLGKGLSVLVDILNPEKIVIGGVYMRSAALLIPAMQKQMQKECLAESLRVCEVVPAKLSENIGDIAAIAVGVLS